MDGRPFCCKCNIRLRCQKNEVAIKYGGNEDRPSVLWDAVAVGDLWGCPGCGIQIIKGWAYSAWYPQNESEAKEVLRIARAIEEGGKNWIALDEVRRRAGPV